jgi:hypothetical protein
MLENPVPVDGKVHIHRAERHPAIKKHCAWQEVQASPEGEPRISELLRREVLMPAD